MRRNDDDDIIIDLRDNAIDLVTLDDFVPEGDVVGVRAAVANGQRPLLVNPMGWAIPKRVLDVCATDPALASSERVAVMDELVDIVPGVAFLRPPSLILGIEMQPTATERDLLTMVTDVLAAANLARSSVAFAVASAASSTHPALSALGTTVIPLSDEDAFGSHVDVDGTVLERAVLENAGKGANLCVSERTSQHVSLCVVRRAPSYAQLSTANRA